MKLFIINLNKLKMEVLLHLIPHNFQVYYKNSFFKTLFLLINKLVGHYWYWINKYFIIIDIIIYKFSIFRMMRMDT